MEATRSSLRILATLIEEANAAQAHFQTWWALRNLALPDFYDTMNDRAVRLFFLASNTGHYKLVFHQFAKIFDRDPRSAGLRELKTSLREEGLGHIGDALDAALRPIAALVQTILRIRNRTVAHNEHALAREKVYELNGITAAEIRRVIDVVGDAINDVAASLNHSGRVMLDRPFEEATLTLLDQLRRGRPA